MTGIKKYFLFLFLFPALTIGQNKKAEEAFRKTCITIADAFAKQNFKALNKYIHRQTGVYVTLRPGAIDAINKYDSLDNNTLPFYPYKDKLGVKKYPVKYGKAPSFDCGTEKWDKKGFYADTTTRSKRASELMDFLTKNEMGTYDKTTIAKVTELEMKSRKVVLTELAKKHGVVFHLVLINGKWYLWLVDTVVSDCSA